MIPIIDLKAQYQSLKADIDSAVERVLTNASYILGPEVEAFEKEFAAYCESNTAIGTSSGTSALHMAMLGLGVKPADEVITVPFTFIATVSAIDYSNAAPVFVDIDPNTYTMDPTQLERAITPKTKLIVPVHLYGQPADMDPILSIAKKYGVPVLEDAAQAHGATYHGRRAGALGDAAIFSFYPAKNLGACGEGGAITTSNLDAEKMIRMLRDWGQPKKYLHELRGFNYRLEGIQGAILRVKLRHLETWTERRRTIAGRYDGAFRPLGVQVPAVRADVRHVYHIYALRVRNRPKFAELMNERGVSTAIHYPTPVHLQPAFAHLGYKPGDFPASEQAAAEVLSIPIYPEMTDAQVDQVIDAVAFAHRSV